MRSIGAYALFLTFFSVFAQGCTKSKAVSVDIVVVTESATVPGDPATGPSTSAPATPRSMSGAWAEGCVIAPELRPDGNWFVSAAMVYQFDENNFRYAEARFLTQDCSGPAYLYNSSDLHVTAPEADGDFKFFEAFEVGGAPDGLYAVGLKRTADDAAGDQTRFAVSTKNGNLYLGLKHAGTESDSDWTRWTDYRDQGLFSNEDYEGFNSDPETHGGWRLAPFDLARCAHASPGQFPASLFADQTDLHLIANAPPAQVNILNYSAIPNLQVIVGDCANAGVAIAQSDNVFTVNPSSQNTSCQFSVRDSELNQQVTITVTVQKFSMEDTTVNLTQGGVPETRQILYSTGPLVLSTDCDGMIAAVVLHDSPATVDFTPGATPGTCTYTLMDPFGNALAGIVTVIPSGPLVVTPSAITLDPLNGLMDFTLLVNNSTTQDLVTDMSGCIGIVNIENVGSNAIRVSTATPLVPGNCTFNLFEPSTSRSVSIPVTVLSSGTLVSAGDSELAF